MSIIKEWSGISESLKKSGASLGDIENARKQFIADIPQKAKSAGLNDEQTQSAISAFDTFTKDQLTEDERYGVDNPIKGGIKQAGKEIYTALAQGAGRMVGGAARLYNDIGDNEKGTFADNLANAMEEDYQARDEAAGLGYQQAEGARGFGKMMVQNIPQLAATYLPVAALKGTAALRGAKAGAAAIAAGKTVEAANAAKAAAIASTITKGSTTAKAASLALNYTGEYGDVSHTVAQKIKNTTVDELRNSEEYGAEFNALERQYYQQGMSADEASQKAKEYLLDNIRERRADVGAAVNTALEWIAPNAVSAINKMGGKKVGKAGDELTERAVADAIGNKRFSWGSKKEVANLGKQMGQEAAQEGYTEYLGEGARANIHNSDVDWGNVAHSAALGALGGGIMGHGVHTLTTGGLQAERAKVLQQLDSISTSYQSATQAVADNKAKLDVLNANQGNLTAADIAAKQQLEEDIALNQQVADQYEKQLKEAGALSTLDQNPNNPVVDEPIVDANVDTTQANDELKAMAERGDIPDFKTMTLQYGISPENLANMYSRHKKNAQLKANVAEHIKQGDTQAAQEAMSQAGIKQEEADAILDEAISLNAPPENIALGALNKLLNKKPNADFAKDVLPLLRQKKYKINSTSEALALWNEARKANKSATPNAPQPKQSTTATQTQNTAIEPVVNNEPPTKVTTPSTVPMEVKATPEPVAEIPPIVNNNSPTKDNTEPLVEHTTTKGKTIKGVVRKGITKEEAKLVDPYTFAKDGGFFIREKYLTPQQENTNTAKEEIKRAAESVAKEVLAEANLPTKSQQGNDGVIEDISGEYQHEQSPDAVATVTKTDKGYEINWGDEVESFTGKNAAIKAKASLIKEKFNKKKPKQDGDGGVTIEPMPKKPISPTNTTPKTTSSTTGEQIAEAMDKTAQAITEAAHNKVVERVKSGEEIVYKQPAAVERVKQDERYQVEFNDKGHAIVKNVKDAQGNWVKPDMSNQSTQAEQRVEKKTEIKDEPKAYGKNVVSVYLTQGGQDGLVISKNEDKYHYTGKFGAGSGHSHADMLKIVNGIKSSKRGVKLGYGVEFELIEQSEQKAEQPKQDKPIKKTPIQGKDVWTEVEFIAGNKSKELFYHNRMADPNKPFNTEAEAIADWESKTEQKLNEKSSTTIEKEKQSTKNQFDEKNGVISASDVTKIQAQTQAKASAIGTKDGFVKFPEGAEYGDYTIMVNRGKYKQEQEVAALIMFKNDGTYRVVQSIFDDNPSSSGVFDKRNAVDEIIRIINTEKLKFDENTKPTPSENTVFTEDAANKARELLKRKLRGQLNSGIDPEMFVAGVTLAGYHVEKGARTFAAYVKAIIDDLGIEAKPYLKSWYMGLKYDPRASGFNDMSSATEVDGANIDILVETALNDTASSQTSRDNARERVKTPESNQVQRASKSEPAQANTQERDDGVSANSGGREVTGDRGNNNSGQSSVRGNANGKSTSNQSSVLPSGTRSTESSDGTNLRNYRIQPNELKRTGSWRATAEQNVQIVELVKTIIAENRAATPEEKALLTKFTGWGASEIANGIFPNQYGSYKDASWKALGERLEAALSPEEYAQAKRTTQYAHYTSEPIIRSVYAALSRFGFNGGSLVEPGMGVGLFNGLMPDAMANNSQYTGVEYDTITGNIAKLLYPDSNIIVGDFTQTKLPKNFFDVAIGNPPFGSIKIQSDPEYKKQGFLLHDYFFAKTIDRVKEGGLLVFVTSKGTMDKTNDRARKYLSDRADLVGAIRLPQTAFKDNAGTEVVTDVIFLRKRMAGEEPAGEAWAGLKEITTPQGKASINEYFATHPEMILGKSALTGSMYRANEYTVEPIAGSDIETLFSEAINNLPENIYTPQRGSKAEQAAVQRRDYDPKIKKEGGIYVADDGVLMQVNNGQGTPLTQKQNSKHELVDLSPKEMQWLKDYVGVRDALKQAQYDQLQDNPNWQQSLEALNKTYDAFVKKHGFIEQHTVSERENEDGSTTVTKRFKNHGLLFLDAEGALARTLEDINPDNSISKAPALLGRVINKPSTPVITSTQDAMFVVFNELGRFDLAKVAKLINKSEKDVVAELGDSIYQDPSTSWTTADDYLSGNVVRKLKEAEQAARLNPKYQRNVAALKAVQPPALAPQDINVQLGAAWIPASDIGLFASEVLGEQRFKVGYSPLTGQWSVEGGANYSSEWGIPAKNSQDILEAVLNNRQIKVTFLDENKKAHTDTEKTEKANDIAKKMRESFKRWLWQDVPRTERLVTYYNEHFNNIAPRVFDGQHLTLPGVSSRFDLRPHQKRAIWRTIQQGDVYYAHAVGAGKTFTMIASGMEERRLGLVKKPMYVVPNHMLAQFSKEFLELYPMANIMVADEQNFHTHNRRKFVAQAALNNPDAIVITHSAFGRIGMSSDYSAKFIKNQIADWQEALQEVGNDERITRKQIERRIEQLENKLKALLDGAKDQLLNFEELGVDRLYVDEGHEFRKLDFPTNRGNIKGIDPSGSQKSMDLYMKVEYLRSKNPNRSLVMASGTPVTNTMGELFTVQRFFNPSQLEEDGDSRFDAWSAHYGEVVDGLEQNAAGGYETVSRFAKFVNVPELMSRVRYFMDILTSNQLGDLVQRPDVIGGGRQVIVTPAPDGYKEYQKDLEKRIKAIRDRKAPPKAGDDIILSVIGDGRFSAIDMRFVDSTLPSDPNSKLNRMLDDLISAYHETANNEYMTSGAVDENKGSSLMLFTDIGLGEQSAKNRGFDMKAWIEKRLIDGGVKREHIAFMRDNKAHSKKEKLFDDMRQGRKRILIGGKDMETGVNAQKRLTHLFHLDAPWFPASVEQREGRIIRQGNQNKIVAIRAYASKGSYDSTMWGMNSRKARFIEQAMSGDSSVRSMEDVSEASAFEMAAALASGDERYLKLAGLKGDVERLGRLYSAHIDEQKRFAREKAHLESSNKLSASKIEQINAAIAQRKPIKAGEFLANVGKKTFDNRDEFSKALFEKFKEVAESYKADEIELGSIAGFPIVYNGVELRGGNFAADLRVDLPIDVEPLAIFPIDPAYSITDIATRAVNQTNALDRELISRKNAIEQNTKDLARIGRRIGASFPEMAELNEKQQALNELEQELNAENKADDANVADGDIANDVRFSQQANQPSLTPLDPVNTRNILDRLLRVFAPKADAMRDSAVLRVRVVKSFADLPLVIQEEAKRQGSNDSDIKGVFHNNTFYAVADNLYSAQEVEQTFFHEVYGHYGVRQLFGKSLNVQLNKLWRIIGGIDGMRKFAKEHGVDLTAYEQGLEKTDYSQEVKNLILMDELLAHIAQVRKPSIKQAFNELMGKIRAWLRQKGFAELSQYNNQDLAHILTQARQAARQSVVLKNNEQEIRYNKQKGMARREFLGLLGAGVGVAALGGGVTLIDQSIKNNAKETAKEKVSSLAENVYNELIKQLNKSDAFVKLAQNIAKAKPSIIGKASAESGFYSITDTYRMEKMYANNEQSNLIDTELRYKDDGTPIFVSRDDVLKKASDTRALLSDNEQKIIAIMSDAIGFVEAITGHNFKKLDIKATTNTPVADILVRKKLGLKDHDTNINARVEYDNPSTVLIHPQTMANLVSTNEKARLHAFQTLSHELVHVLQNQENGVTSDKAIGVNVDTPVLLKNMIGNILESGYSSSEHKQKEAEAFHVGYLATKALLLKEGKPLSTISKAEFLNIINASIDSFTTEQQVTDNFYRNVTFLDAAQFSKTEQSQFDQLLAKADKMIAEQGKLLAPNGKPSKLNRHQWAQVRTNNFKKWFGDWENDPENASKAVDENGEPKVVYHGSGQEFYIFDKKKATDSEGRKYGVGTGKGVFSFTENNDIASNWANRAKNRAEYGVKSDMPTVISAFLNIKRPITRNEFESMLDEKFIGYDFRLPKIRDKFISEIYTELKKKKIDGIMSDFGEITAFYPTQIKSAISNNGEFSPTNPDIRFSIRLPSTPPERSLPQKSVRTAKNMAKSVGESMMNIWTYKIGTKLSIALKHPRYKRVFDLVQAHLNHVSIEVYKAIELAPDLLGKLDTFADYGKRLKTLIPFSGNFDERIKNIEAAAKVIFDGTLIDKQEFNETQLRTKGLTDDQITFYKQARSAINISLKNAAKAEMTRVLLLSNVIGEQVARVVTDRELSMDEHKKELLQLIDTKYQAFKAKRDAAIDKKEKVAIEQKMDGLVDAIKTLNKVAKKANKLIEEGYAPLMRYGDYTSSVYDSKGELLDFRMFESANERDEFVEGLTELNLNMKHFDADKANYDDIAAKKHNGFKVITGTMNNSLFEQFKGITPETLALFADTSNIKQTEVYQEYLKLAVSNNSAFKRLIHRKGIAGYSEDLQRVVASFVMSNARRSAKNIYNKLENDAVNAIPKEQGHLQEDAQKLVNYINNPVEEAQQFRNILFLWNLGLSFMFGLVNLAQPFMVTIPKLSEYTTASNAALRVSAATRLAYSATQKGQAPKGVETEYAQAQREGHLDPQNAFVLAGIERGSTGLSSSYWQSISHGMGLIAQITESMNRKTVFIASMQIGQELQKTGKLKAQGFDSPYDFAIRIIQETQGIYNKGNRGNFARGPFGTVLMMFKQYPIMMVQLMGRMVVNPQYAGEKDKYRKALLLLLAMLWGAAGATGLPFARDILDVIETALAIGGKPMNLEREIQVGLGKEAADWVMNGVNAISPVDVKGRMGMGDLIPSTNIANYVAMSGIGGAQNKEVMQVLGAGGGLVQKFIDGSSALGRGDYRNAVANLAPRSIESMVKGIEMGVTGVYTDRKGNKVRDVSIWDALAKFFDMNPAINARDSRTRGLEARDVMIQGSMARQFKERALDALANNDMAKMDKVDADVAKWNRDNPRYPVEIKARALYRKLRNANKTWQGRDEPPKGMEWMEQYR